MTDEQLNAAIALFRQETEDLVMILVKQIFNIQYAEVAVVTGEAGISVTFAIPYDSITDYEVRILSALDADGTRIEDAVTITNVSANGFNITTARDGVVRWSACRRLPKIEYFTL